MTDQQKKIASIIANHLGREPEEVTEEKHLMNDLGADSLDTVELVMAMEAEFNLEISDEDAEQILTVGDFLRFIEKALGPAVSV